MATVSVIMPCHNGEKYLRQAVESVLAQSYADWELLIIDDASTDGSVTIAEEYCAKDGRIKLLHTQHSTGKPATARNVGIKAATGRFNAFRRRTKSLTSSNEFRSSCKQVISLFRVTVRS